MVTLRVGGKVVSWAEAEQPFAEAAPTQAVEFRNAAGRVIAVSSPADEPNWVKAVTPEETARRMAGPFFTFEEMKTRPGWE